MEGEGALDRLLAPLRGERPPVAAGVRRDAERAVAQGFGRFDADEDGRIIPAEFGRWMAALTPEGGAADAAAEPGWAARAFEQADTDGSGALSRGELARFLADTVSWRLPAGEGAGS